MIFAYIENIYSSRKIEIESLITDAGYGSEENYELSEEIQNL